MTDQTLSKLVGIPSLVFFSIAFVIGVGVGDTVNWQPPPIEMVKLLGWTLLAIGLIIGPGSAIVFLFRGTTLDPAGLPSRLVTGGVFNLTRNPMYLGLGLGYAGLSLVLWRFGPFLLLPVPLILLNYRIIPFEEARMGEAFGNRFALYRRRVRRWF